MHTVAICAAVDRLSLGPMGGRNPQMRVSRLVAERKDPYTKLQEIPITRDRAGQTLEPTSRTSEGRHRDQPKEPWRTSHLGRRPFAAGPLLRRNRTTRPLQ